MKDPSTAIDDKAHFEEGFHFFGVHQQEQCAALKRRKQSSSRDLIHCDDGGDFCQTRLSSLHRTVVEYLVNGTALDKAKSRTDQQLICDPEISLMAMALRLLKKDPQYKPSWILYKTPETSVRGSVIVTRFSGYASRTGKVNGSAQISCFDELNRVCSLVDQEWPNLFYEAIWTPFAGVERNTDMLCLAVILGMSLYVIYLLEKEGKKSLHRIGRALLFYATDGPFDGLPAARILLESGADSNEVCEGKTPWVFMLTHSNIIKPSDTDIFRLMLKRGADPLETV